MVLALREVVLQVSAWAQVVRVLLEQATRPETRDSTDTHHADRDHDDDDDV